MNNEVEELRERSIKLFNKLKSMLDQQGQKVLFEYESILTEIQINETTHWTTDDK